MKDRVSAELRQHEAREEQKDKEYLARIERAKGYVERGNFDLVEEVLEWFAYCIHGEVDRLKMSIAIATADDAETGRLLRKAAIESVASNLSDD